ncbi:hypothetical protein RFX62_16815, partial [Acinetobacter baumannii]|nr:hypothetical protein [Acinetobacter baumannii]
LALHGTPRNLLNAVAKAVPAVSGILIQFPLYGSIAFIMTGKAKTLLQWVPKRTLKQMIEDEWRFYQNTLNGR